MAQALTNILSTRVPKSLLIHIQEIADERHRKIGDIVREALEMYLSEWADYKIAIDRLKDPSDTILSEKEFLDELGWNV